MNEIEAGLYAALSGDTALVSELGSTAVYNRLAPQGQGRPYIVFGPAAGGKQNLNPSDLRSYVYPVKSVADGSKQAGTLANLVLACLHGTALTVSGFTNIYTACETEIQFTELGPDGRPIFHDGWDVRIRIDA